MSHHGFQNLGELIQRYLVSKIRKVLASKDFPHRYCNCNATMKVNGICTYKGECRKCCIVYKVTCKHCNDFYVGNNQNTLKKNGTTLSIFSSKGNTK